MKTHHEKIEKLIETKESPIPIEIIPNNMGINLGSVDSIAWQKQDDGQLVNLTIYFLPNTELK